MKYIIVLPAYQSLPVAILFHYILTHDSFNYPLKNIVSAGFCYVKENGEVRVFGESNSLGKKSREDEDPQIIRETIRPRQEDDEPNKENSNIFRDK